MRIRLVALLLAAAAPLAAQFQLFLVDTLSERPVAPVQDLGATGRGDALTARFRLRNVNTAAAPVRTLEVAGAGYALGAPVVLPQTVNAGAALEFTVVFRASADGLYSAVLRSEGVSSLLTVTVVGQLTISQSTAAGPRELANGVVIDCGAVVRGASASVKLLVQNPTGADQYLPRIDVAGSGFALAAAPDAVLLHPLAETTFEIRFTPAATGVLHGTLAFGSRTFGLSGTALEPPLPRPTLSVALPETRSGIQGLVNVLLSERARTAGSGTLTMEFRPQLPGAVDPSVQFASGGRTATFTVTAGDDRVYFGDQPGMAFQTGTTAGSLVFTVQLGSTADQRSVDLPAAPVGISSVQAARAASSLEVSITGFDNVRTAGPMSFTFYDRTGTAIAPGAIRADSSADFGRYFQSSTLGGLFQLRAVFPVNGDPGGVDAVEVEMTNSAGAVKSQRTRLQ